MSEPARGRNPQLSRSPQISRSRTPDAIGAAAIDQARAAASDAGDVLGVGDHLGVTVEGDRVVTHTFACPHPGYPGWRWAVTLVRASRAKAATVSEVVLVPGPGALLVPDWVPWSERIEAGDVTAGLLMPAAEADSRLEPGFTGGERATDSEPAEASLARVVAVELGLGRERVLSAEGRDEAVIRWLAGDGGPDNPLTKLAPEVCETCGFFTRLAGGLGVLFGACTNAYSPSDGSVVSVDHGCGAHSGVPPEAAAAALPAPAWETIVWDEPVSLFD